MSYYSTIKFRNWGRADEPHSTPSIFVPAAATPLTPREQQCLLELGRLKAVYAKFKSHFDADTLTECETSIKYVQWGLDVGLFHESVADELRRDKNWRRVNVRYGPTSILGLAAEFFTVGLWNSKSPKWKFTIRRTTKDDELSGIDIEAYDPTRPNSPRYPVQNKDTNFSSYGYSFKPYSNWFDPRYRGVVERFVLSDVRAGVLVHISYDDTFRSVVGSRIGENLPLDILLECNRACLYDCDLSDNQ